MTLPGPNQTGAADRRPRLSPSERLTMLRPVHRAMGAGLQLDPAARDLGAHDGAVGTFRLSVDQIRDGSGDLDALAYLTGWVAGQQAKKRES